ncbi:Capsule polysaccharide biosynthesis protein [Kingella potus]|uniref:Capsule polysaccharide biosynthesis protein n=1 Tax=Kingella potus TaxID=265175 RepID=A0A377R0E7_9NEIS|nr:capsule biosynthesis protein [Kingella potus]UOP01042.1 capsular biosynthesis protein [Kingella potus]STR00722.1 Capsule polysaccharide biosynthesis protein [Kingella potus]
MSISILVADSFHINKRNFASFFKFIEKAKPKTIHFEDSHKDWLSLYGVYDKKLDKLYDKIDILSKLGYEDLFDFKIYDIKLFPVCRSEIMTLTGTLPLWYDNPCPESQIEIFDKLFINNKNILLQNMAAAWYWLDFWKRRLMDLGSFTHCCIFSGGLIYQKALIELLKYTPTKVMVMEGLFTGNEYYCEERYSAIANNSDIKHFAVYQHYLNNLETGNEYDRERTKAINKVIATKNKNVEQPEHSPDLDFLDKDAPCVSIIGQVVNDFSVIEYHNTGLSTIHFYKNAIVKLAEAGFNVVMKTHPWEEKKNNIKDSLTKNILEEFINALPEDLQGRIRLVDHYSITKLFDQSKWILGLNSQGLIEAAFAGFKPVQFGNAFYGSKGFTHDYHIGQIDKFIDDIRNMRIENTMSLSEFDNFEKFLTILLQKHVVSVHDSGVTNLQKIFALPNVINLMSPAPVAKQNTQTSVSANIEVKENTQPAESIIDTKNEKKASPPVIVTPNNTQKNRKLLKLKNNPRQFFADSKNPILRSLRIFFKHQI